MYQAGDEIARLIRGFLSIPLAKSTWDGNTCRFHCHKQSAYTESVRALVKSRKRGCAWSTDQRSKGFNMPHSRWFSPTSGLFVAMLVGVSHGAATDSDAPDTSKWKVVFSDKFDRDKVGDRWKVAHGDWTVEDGVLKCTLRKRNDVQYEYHDADIALKDTEIPPIVEVSYDTWSPDEIGSEAKFLTEAADNGIVMAFLGVEHPFYKEKGAMVFVQQTNFKRVAADKTAELGPTVHHKVRLVRKEDRVTLLLDGKEILSADVSDAKELRDLKLHLVGTWGKEGSVVYFDNLEVKVPADQGK